MNCNKYRDEIEELEGGQSLSPSASAHVGSCPSCSAFREERVALRQMINSLEVIDAPADFDFRLRARLARLNGREAGRVSSSRFLPGTRSLALAASFVIIVALGFVIRRQFIVAPGVDSTTPSIVTVTPNDGTGPNTKVSNPADDSNASAVVSHKPGDVPSVDLVVRGRTVSTGLGNARKNAISSNENLGDGGSSVDSSVSSASSVMPPGISDPTLMRSAVALPVRAATRATSITLNDGSSKPRTFTLRPVTFGEQDIFEEPTAKWGIVPAVRGIW